MGTPKGKIFKLINEGGAINELPLASCDMYNVGKNNKKGSLAIQINE